MSNLYSNIAKLYDADNRALFHADIPFYMERAMQLGGKVLELACGTGRITIPLAENGIPIIGLDYSNSMLQVLEEKLSRVGPAVRRNINFMLGDMTSFSLDETFKLIFIPFRSFQALENDEQARACLASVLHHLDAEGQFIVNVFKPAKSMWEGWVNHNETLDFEGTNDSGEKVTRHSIRKAHNSEERLLYIDYIYRVYKQSGEIEQYQDSIRLRYFYEADMRKLLDEAGFEVAEAYGWYDGSPVEEGNELIFICCKKCS